MYRILIIDDDAISTHILSTKLRKQDYSATVYNNPKTVLDDLSIVDNFDIILLDLMMPEVSGFKVLKNIREKYNASKTPVIMITSQDSTDDVVTSLSSGANDYVTKPINYEILYSRISTQTKVLELNKQEIKNKQTQLFQTMVATYNHEINNQLSIAINYTRRLSKNPNNKHLSKKIEDSIEKISLIIKKIENLNPSYDPSMKEYLDKANIFDLDDKDIKN